MAAGAYLPNNAYAKNMRTRINKFLLVKYPAIKIKKTAKNPTP